MLGTPVSLLIGLILILGSVGLFFLDKIKPTYARDSDKVYAVFILIAGILALTHWEINIGESFQMLLMAGMLTTLMIENIRTREPKLPASPQPFDNRPPRPRYSEAPPVRRGYRAELDNRVLDDRSAPGFRGGPDRAPRMAPAQADYWNNGPRQPYEEYRGPAGRLQPSPEARPRNQFDDRYADGNGRYGERPPARPPIAPPSGPVNGQGSAPGGSAPGGSAPDGYQQYPPQRASAQSGEFRSAATRSPNGWEGDSRSRPSAGNGSDSMGKSSNRASNGDRALNVRPLSEAPKIDLPTENA